MDYIETIGKDNSVKGLGILMNPTEKKSGIADVYFRNVYSVFDWGAMPSPEGCEIDNSTLLLMAADNFEKLQNKGVNTHYIGLIDKAGNSRNLQHMLDSGEKPLAMRIRFVNKLKPLFADGKYDYRTFLYPETNNYVIPLEVIFRNELPPESSVWKRIRDKETTLSDLELPETLKPGDILPKPIIDFSTKYESKDRYLKPEDARKLSGIPMDLWYPMVNDAKKVNEFLTKKAESLGFQHPDGKVEFIRDNLKIYLADVAGTWHEDRFSFGGQKISKQLMRDAHKMQDAEWCSQCDKAPKKAAEAGTDDWKQFVSAKPKPLEPEFFEAYNSLTRAATNRWIGMDFFKAPDLEAAVKQFRDYWDDFTSKTR